MKHIWMIVQQLYAFTGKKLYIIIASMVLISFLDSIGLFLIIPLLSFTGIMSSSSSSLPFETTIAVFEQIPQALQLVLILGIFVLLIAGQAVMQQHLALQNTKMNIAFTNHLRYETYRNLLHVNWNFYLKKRKSDLINCMTSELGRIHGGISLFLQLTASSIFTCIQIAIAFWLSWELTTLVLACGALLITFTRRYVKGAKLIGNETTELAKAYLAGITDHFNGMKDIKSNNLEFSRLQWLVYQNNRLTSERIRMIKLKNRSQLIFKMISALLIAVFIFASISMMNISTAQLVLIVLIFVRLWPRFSSMQSTMEQLAAQIPAFQSLLQLQAECAVMSKGDTAITTSKEQSSQYLTLEKGIECKKVSYRYNKQDQEAAINHISLYIPANQMTAIVGRSGAGKSTLIDLIIGLLQPDSGKLLIDGRSLTNEQSIALRNSISYVPQEPFLFNGTIRENMRIVKPDASDEEIWESLHFAACFDLIKQLKDGLDTMLGDRGIRLSGGERQRLVLARAILRKPSILILDEATSALDFENEMKIQAALEQLKGKMTIITIAHRLSSIRHADHIIVLDKGEAVQTGSYRHLAEDQRGLFSKLLVSQGNESAYATEG